MRKKRIIMERMIKRCDDKGDFDREFWKKIGHEGRFAAAWEMISEVNLIRGTNASKSRLQRSIQNIKRRKS